MGGIKKKVMPADWVVILNSVLVILREQVDESGHGVFSLSGVLKDTEFERQTVTITKYLQDIGLLTRGKKTPAGAFNWHLVTDRKVTLAMIRKARAASSKSKPVKAKVQTTKKTTTKSSPTPKVEQKPKPLDEQLTDLYPWDSLTIMAQAAKAEYDALLAENAQLKARLDKVTALVESFTSATS